MPDLTFRTDYITVCTRKQIKTSSLDTERNTDISDIIQSKEMKRVREQRERITEIPQEAARHLEALSYDDV